MRRKSKEVRIGNLKIGGNNLIAVQSMCKTQTKNISATINQIHQLEEAGCEIIRVAVPDLESAKALKEIKKNISIPLVADIHFDYKLAIEAAKYADKLRINPGNIGSIEKISAVVNAAKEYKLPIRIGVNSGSIEKDLIEKYGITASAMVESALKNIKLFEELDFYDIVISLKASDAARTIEAYQLIADNVNYPLHLGITEAGTFYSGIIKSSIGIGTLLSQGIGDTIRVSLTEDPVEEVKAGFEILKALNLRQKGLILISCPTCARTDVDLVKIAKEIEEKTKNLKKPIKIAVMGCVVNGPGEAKEADIGIACGSKSGVIFKKGEKIRTVKEEEIVDALLEEINNLNKSE